MIEIKDVLKGGRKMSKNEDKELAEIYGEAIEKAEKGESETFEIKDAEELFKKI